MPKRPDAHNPIVIDDCKRAVRDACDKAQRVSEEEYWAFLEWVAAEVDLRETAVRENDD